MPIPSFPADSFGNTIPLLKVQYGQSIEVPITVSGITGGAQVISDGTGAIVRVWALNCDIYYKMGVSGLSNATAADALVMANSFFDIPLVTGHTHIQAIVRSAGSGFVRVEKLG
jgi:hypothetical protein